MTNRSLVLRIFTPFLVLFLVPQLSRGQWHPDSIQNTPICIAPGQQDMPKGCSDGSNGAIIVWEDQRSGSSQVYAQHINEFGHAEWAQNGIPLAPIVNNVETIPLIASDDSGGAYVIWFDSRYANNSGACIFAQHILRNGILAYPDTGLPVGIGLNGCTNPTLCDDGSGGAFVAWEDNRTAVQASRPDIWVNRLWPGGVKYGLVTVGNGTGSVFSVQEFIMGKWTNVSFFQGSNAHFRSYLNNQPIIIDGKSYIILSVVNDSQMTLKTFPSVGKGYSYYVPTLCGQPIDTMQSRQSDPTIVADGQGGAYLMWITSATLPTNAVYGTRLDSGCNALWDPEPQPGFKFYQNLTQSNNPKNISMTMDSGELLFAVQAFSSTSNSQQIFADRMNAAPKDSIPLWSSPIEVTSDVIDDKTNPQIFGDDSAINIGLNTPGPRGALVPFIDQQPGASDDYDIAMVRALGNGAELEPPAQTSYWFFDQKPHTQNNLQAMKVSVPGNPSQTGVLSVWADEWNGTDTMIYAQRMDRQGRKYFPAPNTKNTWGLAVTGNSPTKSWMTREPTLIPRTDGAIVAWADFRNGNADIYSQLITNDGNYWIPFDTVPPTLTVSSTSPPDNDQPCNSQSTTITATDPGFKTSGIDSVYLISDTNMMLNPIEPFTKGVASVNFTVQAIDSLMIGSATIGVLDTTLNLQTINVKYCTILDTNTPVITWDSAGPLAHFIVHVRDSAPWSRGLSTVVLSNTFNNSKFSNGKLTTGAMSYDDTVTIIDTTKPACFSVKATTVSSGVANAGPACYEPYLVNDVNATPEASLSLSIYPNPVIGTTVIRLDGAPQAHITISDILGRTIDSFDLEGSRDWDSNGLAAGTYIIRASIGDRVLSTTIAKH